MAAMSVAIAGVAHLHEIHRRGAYFEDICVRSAGDLAALSRGATGDDSEMPRGHSALVVSDSSKSSRR